MNLNKFFHSNGFKVATWTVAGLIVSLFIFKVGVIVGYRKASFTYRWGDSYHRNFGGPRCGFFRDFRDKDFISAHGVFGQIIKIDGSTLVIKGRDEVEKIVSIKNETAIRRFRDMVKPADLKVDDNVVVIGDPNDAGQIEAKFIRLLPPCCPKF